ncbi:hypothetical protein ALC62_14945 [Cyphomyrmex costatus]|uniref:Uncharacterized protein n=1 Tax=Cyphomyrmex costatus TaxID=456900 RepID=A0A195C0Y2_9HYME|nr:hypothetical protein ALC62_14945 [Cyphomyrmex costatus]
MRIPLGLRKDQFFIVLVVGLGTGIYNWNSLIKEHIKECETELQLNEVIGKSKSLLVNKFSRLGLVVISGAISAVGFTTFILPWFRQRKAAKAEKFANFIYEQRKKKGLE